MKSNNCCVIKEINGYSITKKKLGEGATASCYLGFNFTASKYL